MPDMYIAEFFDGPLEGVTFEISECPDKLLIVFDGPRRVRYEMDQITATEIDGWDVEVCRMVLTRDPDSYDAELS